MKLIHLSDLHIGKRVNEFSMLEDQAYILKEILSIIDSAGAQAVIIAGDVYDKALPSAEAVQLFDEFLVALAKRSLQVFIISGNHDSPERVAFGNRLMDASGIHISPVYDGSLAYHTLEDEYGRVNFYLLPFIKPVHVKKYFPESEITSYSDGVRTALSNARLDPQERNILVTHQFVTGASRSESEELCVGGSDNVDISVFDQFDYVALGHIHGPQSIGRDTVRYCGTPLKYSFSEVSHQKSVSCIELKEKGNISITAYPLTPLRDMREQRGCFEDMMDSSLLSEDYMRIILTDEEDVPEAIGKLRRVYPNLMRLDYDNKRTSMNAEIGMAEGVEHRSPLELFSEFYEKQNNQPMTEEQSSFMAELIERIAEDGR